jgi:benzoate membrane transport protein
MRLQPVVAGVIAALVGFASSFTIVLAGLVAVGASDRQASSGLLVLSVSMGAVGMWASWRQKLPISIAWSTPGAALLVSSGALDGGYRTALGAFVVAGVLTVVAGLWRPLARWIGKIPGPLASALLAGVLLPVCFAPAKSMVAEPWMTAPVVIVWAVLMRVARRWAVPGALVTAVVAIAVGRADSAPDFVPSWPHLTLTSPLFDLGTMVGLGIPLFIVTMASQNVAGMAVLRSFGFAPKLRPLLVTTGAVTAVGAPFGAHGINLAALTAALVAGPDADPEPDRRWIASFSCGVAYVVMGLFAGVATALVASAPPVLISAVAGLALLGALTGALASAMADPPLRDAAVITLVVSASGITAFGISAPFWGLSAGLLFHALSRLPTRSPAR